MTVVSSVGIFFLAFSLTASEGSQLMPWAALSARQGPERSPQSHGGLGSTSSLT